MDSNARLHISARSVTSFMKNVIDMFVFVVLSHLILSWTTFILECLLGKISTLNENSVVMGTDVFSALKARIAVAIIVCLGMH